MERLPATISALVFSGGKQEGSEGKKAVQSVFPNASIELRRIDKYPIEVKVFMVVEGNEKLIWSGDQRGLFRKVCSYKPCFFLPP